MAIQGSSDIETLSSFAHHYFWDQKAMDNGDLVIMQFTGLHDKHGKEIYENDVLKITEWDKKNIDKPKAWDTGEVMFRSGAFRINAYLVCHVASCAEIIGNIFENPKILLNLEN